MSRGGPAQGAPAEADRRTRWFSPTVRLGIGLALVMTAWVFLLAADRGLRVRYPTQGGVPMRYVELSPEARADRHAAMHVVAPDQVDADDDHLQARIPGVVVAHGFAGSSTLMLGYAHVLARAGYGVLLPDLPGHGANDEPLTRAALDEALAAAVETLAQEPGIDPGRIALVGHSMGAGAVMAAGISTPERFGAVVAISPTEAPVTPTAPPNLQLQAGTWEPVFLESARELLERAGGPNGDVAGGRGRQLVTVPAAEHLSIVFRDASHAATREWLDAALAPDDLPGRVWRDRRILWWLAHFVGTMLVVSSLAPGTWRPATEVVPRGDRRREWMSLALAPLVATVVCRAVSLVVDLLTLSSVAMAPALGLWFLVAGTVVVWVPIRVARPTLSSLVRGLGTFAFLWLAIGVSAHLVWLHWGLGSTRLLLWPILAAASVPWFAATEAMRHGATGRQRLLWWAAESGVLVTGLWMLAATVPELGLIAILLPLLPLFLGLLSVVGGRVVDPWAAGIGCGALWGWLLAAGFPVLG